LEALFKVPEFTTRVGYKEKKAPTIIEFLGLFFRLDRSDFGIGKSAIRFGMGDSSTFGGFHFPLGAFGLQKGPQSLRIVSYHDALCRTTQKEKGLISQAF
jgi:hypothetical protein